MPTFLSSKKFWTSSYPWLGASLIELQMQNQKSIFSWTGILPVAKNCAFHLPLAAMVFWSFQRRWQKLHIQWLCQGNIIIKPFMTIFILYSCWKFDICLSAGKLQIFHWIWPSILKEEIAFGFHFHINNFIFCGKFYFPFSLSIVCLISN